MKRFLTLAAGILAVGLTVLPEDASAQWRGGWRGGGFGHRGALGGGIAAADGEEAGEAGTVTMAGAGAVERWPLER